MRKQLIANYMCMTCTLHCTVQQETLWDKTFDREKKGFCRENFRELHAGIAKDATPPNFAEKTFANSQKSSILSQNFPTIQQFCKIKNAIGFIWDK